MSDGTITTITILLFVFVLSAFIWPIALGIHLELEGRKKRGEPPAYDERQKLARLRAGSRAMYALLFFLVLWAIVDQIGCFDWTASVLDLVLCALMLTFVVWSGECILRGAMLGFNQRKSESGQIISYFSLGACWTIIGGTNTDAMSSSLRAVQMLMGGSFLILGILMLYARYKRRRSDAGDGEV